MSDVSAPITWRGRVTAVLIGLLLLGIAAEPVLRIAMPNWSEYHSGRFMMRLNVPDQPVTSIGVPGFDGWFSQNNGDFRVRIRINEFGLRNDQPANAADNRIWILGDSMSFGWGVERTETYTQILADRLGAGTYNVATPGSSVCGWQTLYSRMPRELRPTAVVVGLTIENRMGLYDCTAEARVVPLAPEPVSPSLSAAKTFLTEHSAVKQGGALPELTGKEVELRRLYAVLSAISYLANQKAIKREISVPSMTPSYNSTPQPASGY